MTAIRDIEARLGRDIGLDVRSLGPNAVTSAVRSRMRQRGIQHDEEYAALLLAADTEMQELIEQIVVPETWFFRDRQPFLTLGRWAMDEWFPARSSGVLRLLSMPCASGEEPYSMVMSLLDAGAPPERFVVEGLDISAVALERARQAVYGRNSFRGHNLEFRDKYFHPAPDGWRLTEAVRQQVQFRQANVLAPALGEDAGTKDVVFCRNVLIYFDAPAQHRVMTTLDRLLSPDGLLFVGHAEAFVFRNFGFAPAGIPMAFAFRKCGVKTPAPDGQRRHQLASGFAPNPALAPGRLSPAIVRPMKTAAPAPQFVPPPKLEVAAGADPHAELTEAHRLADAGCFEAALEKCAAHLKAHGPSGRAFYLLGLVNDAAGRTAEASDFYRKALYLEPDHYEALAQLSLLAQKSGDARVARQLQQRAKRAREKLPR